MTAERIEGALAPHVAAGEASGVVALVGEGDGAEMVALGTMAYGGDRPMRADAIFRIASMTKPIVAAAALMLVEDGELELDEPVDRLLPELARRRVLRTLTSDLADTVPAHRAITVEDLLTFRLGTGILFGDPAEVPILRAIADRNLAGFGPPDPAVPYGPDEWLRRLGELPLMAQPGERWLYTTGSNVLGVLIARAAGQPLPELLQDLVFGPLGMADTGFFVPPEKLDRLPAAYWPAPDGPALNAASYASPPRFPAGDSGLVSTAADIFAVSRFLLSGGLAGERRRLSEPAIAAMTRDQLTPAQRAGGAAILTTGVGWGYGVGVAVEDTPAGVPVGTFGWNGGLGTSWQMDPATGRTAILLTQTAFTSPDPPAIHKTFWRAVFG